MRTLRNGTLLATFSRQELAYMLLELRDMRQEEFEEEECDFDRVMDETAVLQEVKKRQEQRRLQRRWETGNSKLIHSFMAFPASTLVRGPTKNSQ